MINTTFDREWFSTMISVHVKRTKGNVGKRLVKIGFKINQVTQQVRDDSYPVFGSFTTISTDKKNVYRMYTYIVFGLVFVCFDRTAQEKDPSITIAV